MSARKRLLGDPDQLVWSCAEHLPFSDGVFANVVSLGLLEHCTDPDPVCQEAKRGVAHGGGFHLRKLRAKLVATGFTVLRFSRINALLALSEIPRELRATRRNGTGYHGILGKAQRRVVGLMVSRGCGYASTDATCAAGGGFR